MHACTSRVFLCCMKLLRSLGEKLVPSVTDSTSTGAVYSCCPLSSSGVSVELPKEHTPEFWADGCLTLSFLTGNRGCLCSHYSDSLACTFPLLHGRRPRLLAVRQVLAPGPVRLDFSRGPALRLPACADRLR